LTKPSSNTSPNTRLTLPVLHPKRHRRGGVQPVAVGRRYVLGLSQIQAQRLPPLFECITVTFTGNCYNYTRRECTVCRLSGRTRLFAHCINRPLQITRTQQDSQLTLCFTYRKRLKRRTTWRPRSPRSTRVCPPRRCFLMGKSTHTSSRACLAWITIQSWFARTGAWPGVPSDPRFPRL